MANKWLWQDSNARSLAPELKPSTALPHRPQTNRDGVRKLKEGDRVSLAISANLSPFIPFPLEITLVFKVLSRGEMPCPLSELNILSSVDILSSLIFRRSFHPFTIPFLLLQADAVHLSPLALGV